MISNAQEKSLMEAADKAANGYQFPDRRTMADHIQAAFERQDDLGICAGIGRDALNANPCHLALQNLLKTLVHKARLIPNRYYGVMKQSADTNIGFATTDLQMAMRDPNLDLEPLKQAVFDAVMQKKTQERIID